MYINLDSRESSNIEYLVVAGNGNNLNRMKVTGHQLKAVFSEFDRVTFIGKIQCFECYLKNDEGVEGWDIVYIEGVKEKIERHYPLFDCFITQDYPLHGNGVIKFDKIEREDYDLVEFNG